jgi:hypothetical protein
MTDIPLYKYTKIGLYTTLFTSNVVDIYNFQENVVESYNFSENVVDIHNYYIYHN